MKGIGGGRKRKKRRRASESRVEERLNRKNERLDIRRSTKKGRRGKKT